MRFAYSVFTCSVALWPISSAWAQDRDAQPIKVDRDSVAAAAAERRSAAQLAEQVLQATQLVAERSLAKKTQAELVCAAIESLFEHAQKDVPADLRDLLKQSSDMTVDELRALLVEARRQLGRPGKLPAERELTVALDGMLRQLDPYSGFSDAGTLAGRRFQKWSAYSSVGIVFRISKDLDLPVVVTPLKDGPAHRGGIQEGDIITHLLPTEQSAEQQTWRMSADDFESRIVGPAGKRVNLRVERPGVDRPLEFSLQCAAIELETVVGQRRQADLEWNYWIDQRRRIAYVRLANFFDNAMPGRLERVLAKLEEQGARGLVLDLRFNPGGRLQVGLAVADLLLDEELIVSVQSRRERVNHRGQKGCRLRGVPIVCLMNGTSASVSEMLAACLEDHGRAVVAGQRSFGKGSVQEVYPFAKGEIKLTAAHWLRPSGAALERTLADKGRGGVVPEGDLAISLEADETDELFKHLYRSWIIPRPENPVKRPEFSDRQLDRALAWLRQSVER